MSNATLKQDITVFHHDYLPTQYTKGTECLVLCTGDGYQAMFGTEDIGVFMTIEQVVMVLDMEYLHDPLGDKWGNAALNWSIVPGPTDTLTHGYDKGTRCLVVTRPEHMEVYLEDGGFTKLDFVRRDSGIRGLPCMRMDKVPKA